jgi:hypothetical protein
MALEAILAKFPIEQIKHSQTIEFISQNRETEQAFAMTQ